MAVPILAPFSEPPHTPALGRAQQTPRIDPPEDLEASTMRLIINAKHELHEPPRVSGVYDAEIGGATDIRTRGGEVRSVKCIKHLPAELEPGTLSFQGKVLGNHDVPGLGPGASQDIAG